MPLPPIVEIKWVMWIIHRLSKGGSRAVPFLADEADAGRSNSQI
jgi:hypothetical protein